MIIPLSVIFIWTPINIVWILLYLPILYLSKLYYKIPSLRIPLAILGFPFAYLGSTYMLFITDLGEKRSKA